jgi:flagellum-specific ATP synthase
MVEKSEVFFPKISKLSRKAIAQRFKAIDWQPTGKVCDVVGTIVEAKFPRGRLGTVVKIDIGDQERSVLAEIVGFRDERTLLLPFSHLGGISPGGLVYGQKTFNHVPVGDFLLGKIIDPFVQSLDSVDLDIPDHPQMMLLDRDAPNPLSRHRIEHQFSLGIRSLDALLTFGEGQRLGIMAGSGVGKSVLMGMIAKGSGADVNVIGLIGERGREVREFIERDLGSEGLKKSVVVVVTSDQSPLMRLRGAKTVTAIAEYFSAKGKKVLLMMDSLTRVAQAQREIGLAVGEPPTVKGYPPSVYTLLPRLLERCGPQQTGSGSISGLYTVLVDADDFNDPIPDAARAILDGHIQLSRDLATKGHFPAIDVTRSVSRVMHDIVDVQHWETARMVKELLSVYRDNFDYVQLGSYMPGSNQKLDQAIKLMPKIEKFLRQNISEKSNLDLACAEMFQLIKAV